MEKIIGILKETGLSENEAKIYLCLLKSGQSKVNQIYQDTNIMRTFIYELLRELNKKGLVSYSIKNGVRYYEASSPSILKSFLKEKEVMLDKIIPELKSIKKTLKEKPVIEIYEGKEGIKTILEDILKMKSGEILYSYANSKIFELLRFYFPHFIKKRAKRKIILKIIQEKSQLMKEYRKHDKKEYREMRLSPVVFKSNIFIFEDKVAILVVSEKEPLGVLIKNKEIAETQIQVFNLLWKLSK